MSAFLKWAANNFVYIILVALFAALSFFVWRVDHTTDKLEAANEKAEKLSKEIRDVTMAMKAVTKEAQAEAVRVVRVEREVQYVQAQPVTATCGDSVHDAVDFMRQHKSENPK